MGRHSNKKWDGPTIREMRAYLGLSQTQFSKKFGIPLRTIVSWEAAENISSGHHRRPPDYIYKLLSDIVYCKQSPQIQTPLDRLHFCSIRAALGWTQAKFSEHFLLNKSTLGRWEAFERCGARGYGTRPSGYVYKLFYWALYGHPYEE